jgi:hypothetical protein
MVWLPARSKDVNQSSPLCQDHAAPRDANSGHVHDHEGFKTKDWLRDRFVRTTPNSTKKPLPI